MITKKQVDTNLSKEELLQMLAVKQNQINSLLEVTKAVNNNYSKHAIFRIFEFILRAQFDVNKILLYSRTAKDGEWVCGMEHNAEDAIQKINVERDLERFQFIQKITNFPFEGFENFDLLIPISHKKEPLAYLLLGCPLFEGEIETANDQVKLIETLANIIVVSLENKRLFKRQLEQSQLKKEMDLAAEVQQLLIPTKLDISPSIEAYGHYEPHGEIGGDYYDYLQYSDHEYALCICDVSGKGLSAGMLMSNFQANLRALISREYPLEQIVDMLNFKIREITKSARFITMFLGVYDHELQIMRYINAGHNPPILLQNGEQKLLKEGCPLLGALTSLPNITIGEVAIEPGAILFMYTDGLIEIENEEGAMYDLESLQRSLENAPKENPQDLSKYILHEADQFRGQQPYPDDLSLLVCKFIG